jgi:DNA mismatch repair protein MutS2
MTSLEVLEFHRITAAIGEYACTEDGRRQIIHMTPSVTRDDVVTEKEYVREILELLEKGRTAPSGAVLSLPPLFEAVQREGADLDAESLSEVRHFLDYAVEEISFCRDEEGEPSRLAGLFGDITVPEDLHRDLRRYITDDGRVNEDAIPEISRLKERAAQVNRTLIQRSEGLIRSDPTLYHGDRPTVRDGRTVIPLAANFKGRIDGIVHEASGSGETLFVEPRELVDLNNELTQTSHAIHQEIRRLLRQISASVRRELEPLEHLYEKVVMVDSLTARARWGFMQSGSMVRIGDVLDLRHARHPLIGPSCVPLNINFDRGINLLVVSGPNTGGKTVLIKTVGLLSVLHQCAVPVPADPDSTLPMFDYWGVDIGDEQSIDEHLSTFSAHMRRIAAIVDSAGPKSLILLDELGSGTDPDEGGALSMAIVDTLMERGCTTIVSTHQTVLKHYGYTREGARNVSMDFDQDTHRPTYRIVSGRPGSSHAIETAREQGLDASVLEAARGYASDRQSSVSEIINRLLEQEQILHRRMEELSRQSGENEERARRVTELEEVLHQKEQELRRGYLRNLDRMLSDARKAVEGEIRRIRERGNALGKEDIRRAHDAVGEMESLRRSLSEETDTPGTLGTGQSGRSGKPAPAAPGTDGPERPFHPGMTVIHERTGKEGVVKNTDREGIVVQFGGVRMTVQPEDIRETTRKEEKVHFRTQLSRSTAVLELDLRGKRLHEALAELELQVDGAVLRGLRSFSIIHGTGTGVLQKGVHDYLKKRAEVTSFGFASAEDGGFGKTTVELSASSG